MKRFFPQTFKVLRSVWLAPATLNDSQTEVRTLQQWLGQQSSPLTTLALCQPLLRVVWRASFTVGDILSRTTPLMRQQISKPAPFSSLSRVRLKNWCPCSSRFVFHFWLVGGNHIKGLGLLSFFFFLVLKCQTLLPPLNGFIDGKCDNSYGSTCSIRCSDGYNLIGAENITCEAASGHVTGYWNNAVPVCKGKLWDSLTEFS